MPSQTSFLAWATTAMLFQSASAHMIMGQPVPFNTAKLDNSPLAANQFPCRQDVGFDITTMNNMTAGAPQTLSFIGSAVHGGGSCQLAVTLDTVPKVGSAFKVIKSFEGACPGMDAASTFSYVIPEVVPNGRATFAWTWFSRLSGVPEMYMNCAPITVTGGASDSAGFEALPDLFVANIPEVDCKTVPNFPVKLPNPGSVNQVDNTFALKDPVGAACGAAVGGGGGDSQVPDTSAPAVVAPTPTPTAAPVAPSSVGGGIFAPGASSAVPDPVASNSIEVLTTLIPVTVEPPSSTAVVTAPAPPVNTGLGDATGNSCAVDGAVVCNGPTQFGLCNFGKVVWQNVAAGTTCTNGVISRRSPSRIMKRGHRNAYYL